MHGDSIKSLVERFLENPGDEDDAFEVKRRAKVDNRQGRLEVVDRLHAMANTRGGTMLIGLGAEADGSLVIDSFEPESEVIRDIMSMARDRTTGLDSYIYAYWEKRAKRRILRIDVERVRGRVISFKNERGDWVAKRRVHSTTRVMRPDEIVERSQEGRSSSNGALLIAAIHADGPAAAVSRRLRLGPSRRVLTETDDDAQPVFGEGFGIEGFLRPALYRLSANAPLGAKKGWEKFFAQLHDHLGLSMERLTYSIKANRRVQCGVGLQDLLQDVASIEALGRALLDAPPTPPKSRFTRVLPLVTGYVPYPGGLFWFQAEYEGDGFWFHQECGLVLNDLPFDDGDLRAFFASVGSLPSFWEGRVDTQGFEIRGRIKLRRARHVVGVSSDYRFLFMEADNPFFGKAEALHEAFERAVHRSYLDDFCSIPRLMFQVSGGRIATDKEFWLNAIHVVHMDLRATTLFINASAWANR